MEKNFEDIKVGDKVIISQRFHGDSVVSVSKVTKDHFVIDMGNYTMKFRKRSGTQVGGDTWTPWYAEVATEERIAEVTEKNMRWRMIRTCRDFNFEELPTDKLKEVYKIITTK